MTSFLPGSVVLYREPGADHPPWPSVYCTDDMAPSWFVQKRPKSHVTLVLRLSSVVDADQLRWATPDTLSHFDPFGADEATKLSTPGLREAYEIADNALDTGLDLTHWKATIGPDHGLDDDTTILISEDEEDFTNDPDLLLAIESSLDDIRAQEVQHFPKPSALPSTPARTFRTCPEQSSPPSGATVLSNFEDQRQFPILGQFGGLPRLSTPSPSPPGNSNAFRSASQSLKRLSPPSSSASDEDLPSPAQKRKLSGGFDAGRNGDYPTTSQNSEGTLSYPLALSDDEISPMPPLRKYDNPRRGCSGLERRRDTPFLIPTSVLGNELHLLPSQRVHSSRPTAQYSLPQSSGPNISRAEQIRPCSRQHPHNRYSPVDAASDGDFIDGDIEDSNDFVQVFVGPEVDPTIDIDVDPERRQHRFQLMKGHVWNRSYFRNTVHAISYISPIGKNTWELTHPKLSTIDPIDFKIAAEYLTDGNFGLRRAEGEEQAQEAFAQCMSAWEVAQQLNMDDLQEHIIEKVQGLAPWDMYNVFAFSLCVYDTDEVSSEACRRLKDMLCTFIAEHFTIYMRDEALKEQFLDRMEQLPQLDIDIHRKYAKIREGRRRQAEQTREILEQQQNLGSS